MVIPGIPLIGCELPMRTRPLQLYKAVGLIGILAIDEELDRITRSDFERSCIALQFAFYAPQVIRSASLGGA